MITVFSDSAAGLTKEMTDSYGIKILNLHCYIDGAEVNFSGGFDGKSYYKSMREGGLTRTSMVNISEFADAFEKELKNGSDIIYVGISAGISGTVQSAVNAAAELKELYPDRKIAVVDTKAASLGEGMIAMKAASLVKDGLDFDEVLQKTEETAAQICQYFTVESLTYLQRGGRISKVTAKVGNILDIKPILKGEDGKIINTQKVRGTKKAFAVMAQKYDEMVSDKNADVAISHADNSAGADILSVLLLQKGLKGNIIKAYYDPVTGAHAGPGAVSLSFFKKP